jgi:hypothetical protein
LEKIKPISRSSAGSFYANISNINDFAVESPIKINENLQSILFSSPPLIL